MSTKTETENVACIDPQVDAAFLGPMAENADLLERWVVQAVRDYAYWRRNVHPEDRAAMNSATELHPDFVEVRARTEDALRRLAARMKRSVPWFSPRHMGHMASDLLMPDLVGRVLGTLYKPNNVSSDAAGASVEMELEVGLELAKLFGFETDRGVQPWGHLTRSRLSRACTKPASLWNPAQSDRCWPALFRRGNC